MTNPVRISYAFMFILLILVGGLNMATLLLTSLFAYLTLRVLSFGRSKALALFLFTLLGSGVTIGFVYFCNKAYVAFPQIADTTVPAVVEYAQKQGVELPFTDYASLKEVAMEMAKDQYGRIGGLARAITFQVVYLVFGVVVAVSLFFNAKLDFDSAPKDERNTLYAHTATEIRRRFRTFFESFARVMGAQLLISVINTAMTAVFLYASGVPHATVLTVTTFICGLLPIIGNLISNTLITGVAFTVKPELAAIALVFLITIHKFEYFLNSKIIGDRIKNPMWLTLVGIILGERLMGIPGMILAPVVLHYLKVEASKQKMSAAETARMEETVSLSRGSV